MKRVRWLGEHKKGDAAVRVGEREGGDLVVAWEGLGELVVAPDGSHHAFTPAPDLDAAGAKKLERGVVRALVRHLQGKLTLHGSAVALGGRAVVCVGPSGAGKSTLAALLVRAGGELLADDMTSLEVPRDPAAPVLVAPSEETFSLDDASVEAVALPESDSADVVNWEGKWLVPAARVAPAPRPLAAILSLSFGGQEPSVHALRGLEVLAALVPCVPRFPTDDRARHEVELAQLEALARRQLVRSLERPRDLASIDRTVSLVQRLAG